MKNRIIYLSLFVGLFILAQMSISQTHSIITQPPKKSPEAMMEEHLQKIKKDLALTDEQTVKVKDAMQERHKKVEAAIKLNNEKDKKEALDKADKEFDTKMKTILTDDQYKKFQAQEAEMKKKRPQNMPPPRN